MADKKKTEPKLIYETPESLYLRAVSLMQEDELFVKFSYKKENYLKAAEMFKSITGYKDADSLAEKCRLLAEQADRDAVEREYVFAAYELENAQTREDYEQAEALLEKVAGYKDADRLRGECAQKVQQFKKRSRAIKGGTALLFAAVVVLGVVLLSSGKLEVLKNMVIGTSSETAKKSLVWGKDLISGAAQGDEVTFGSHQWCVLKNDGTALLLVMLHSEQDSELRGRPYNDELTDVTWEDSTVRKWLNTEFKDSVFSEEEKECMQMVICENRDNPAYGTSGGEDTSDQVFLPSSEDISEYESIFKQIRMNLWLRDPGNAQDTAMFMASNTEVMDYGYAVDSRSIYCVPMICISYE